MYSNFKTIEVSFTHVMFKRVFLIGKQFPPQCFDVQPLSFLELCLLPHGDSKVALRCAKAVRGLNLEQACPLYNHHCLKVTCITFVRVPLVDSPVYKEI